MTEKKLISIFDSKCWVGIVILFLFTANSLQAQSSTVIALVFNGKSVDRVETTVFAPNKGSNTTQISINQTLASETKLSIPPGTIIKLRSPGGQQIVSNTGTARIEYKVEFHAQGETHIAKGLGAKIVNTVNKTVGYNYKNTNERGTTAASKGTVFTFTDLSESKTEKATITTSEGAIHIIDEVPVKVGGQLVDNGRHGNPTTKSSSLTQSAGSGSFTSSDEAIEYASLAEAVNALLKEIAVETDPEELADDRMCLGDLYMDMEKPALAIKPYSDAANYYDEEYGEDDLSTLEAKLSLADAYNDTNNKAKGAAIISECIELLEEMLSDDEEELAFAKKNNDTESQEFIIEDIADLCDLLGYAYEIKGNEAKSNAFYKRAERLMQK